MGTSNTSLRQAESVCLTRTASGAIAIGDIVTLTSTAGAVAKASTEATGFGVAVSEAADGQDVSICVQGYCKVKCGEAFSSLTSLPAPFVNDTDGYAHLALTNQRIVGWVIPGKQGTGYADLDLAECIVNPCVFYAA